jgi:predicted MPP superfamily phosphohydrolase
LFASFFAYQLIDLLLAAALALAVMRGIPRSWKSSLERRHPVALATPFRRLMLVEFGCFLVLVFLATIAGKLIVFPAFDRWARGHPQIQRAANVGAFLMLGIAWQGMVVLFPLAGAWSAWRPAARRPEDRRVGRVDRALAAVLLLGAAGLTAYACVLEPNHVVVEQVDVALPGWPAGRAPLRVVLLADLQSARLGERERRLPDLVASLKPDAIVIAGDLVAQTFDESLALDQARHVLRRLSAPLGVFVVNGDVDDVVDGGMKRIVEGCPVRLLDNERVLLASDPPVELCGADPRHAAGLERLVASPRLAPLSIGLVHRPRHHVELGLAGCQLVLAGHTHGGQVVVPGFGPPITLETVPRDVAAGGLHRMDDGTQLYVTRGIGVEGGFAPRIRFLCPPEVTLLRIGPVSPPPPPP